MKVIVAGMPKTGTKSMNAALTLLGYEVYDWMKNFYYLGDDWIRIIERGGTIEDFRRMYKNVDAVADGPCYAYWEELAEAFPNAKVRLLRLDLQNNRFSGHFPNLAVKVLPQKHTTLVL